MCTTENKRIGNWQGVLALSPIVVFLSLYLVVSLVKSDFYCMPLSVAFIASSVWALLIYRPCPLKNRIDVFVKAAGGEGIMYMVMVFILAGGFAFIAKQIGAVEATVNATLNILPFEFILPGIFVVACFISLSVGTSVGTVVALTPLAVELAHGGNAHVALFVAAVLGGAFFGDNLSFISDTTIAATRSQGVGMDAKFKANLKIVLPAAVLTLALYSYLGMNSTGAVEIHGVDYVKLLPYLAVIVLALCGVNVMVVLLSGIVAAMVVGCLAGDSSLFALLQYLGQGVDSMGELIIITILSAGMLGVVRAMGGVDYLLHLITKRINSVRGAKASIAFLVGIVDVCTANNTVAIITVGTLSRKISDHFGISGARTASLLDTSSCIVQCLIPYGAQTLIAVGIAGLSPEQPWAYLYYPWFLIASLTASIFFTRRK